MINLVKSVIKKNVFRAVSDQAKREAFNAVKTALATGGSWIFTQRKSGSTLICNFLASYNSSLLGKAFDLGAIHKFGVFREASSFEEALAGYLAAERKHTGFIMTHRALDAKPQKLILTYRNAYDQIYSAYQFLYVNRNSRGSIQSHEALKKLAAQYCDCFLAQRDALAYSENSWVICYDDLMSDSEQRLRSLIEFIFEEVVEQYFQKALMDSSVESVLDHEGRTGRAIVASDSYTASSFIRSGKVGEGLAEFTPHQIAIIDEVLKTRGVNPSGNPKYG